MTVKKSLAWAAIGLAAGLSQTANSAEGDWFRQAAISPDGDTIAFSYLGNIFTVPARGGTATPLTTHAAWEGHPVWSRDGSQIAFASDRYGNKDIFVMPATGGTTKRLTYHQSDDIPSDFHPDGSHVLFTSVRQDSVQSSIGFTRAGELYSASLDGGTPEMVLTTPASEARYNEDASQIIYRSETGYEDEFRKHDKSPFSRDVWIVNLENGSHTNITNLPGGDHSPVFGDRAGRSFFISDRDGIFNIYRMRGDDVEALTSFSDHPVRSLSRAEDGTLAFTNHGEIFTLKSGRLRKVAVNPSVSMPEGETVSIDVARNASEFALSPDGKEIAFIARGDVFVTSIDYATTRKVTQTPEEEADIAFSADGKTIYYSGERDGKWQLYEVTRADADEPYFYAATTLTESKIDLPVDQAYQPTPSPDGKKLAFMGNTRTLMVLERENGTIHELSTPLETFNTAARGTTFSWSPDSRYVAFDLNSNGRMFFTNIAVRPFDASAPARNISLSGYTDATPVWHPSGDAITWFTARYGRRDHGSHGTEFDAVAGFLTDEGWTKFLRSKEDVELDKKREDDAKKKAEAEKSDEEEATSEEDSTPETAIDWERLDKRQQRLTIHSSDLRAALLSKDMDKLFYVTRFEGDFDLWVQDFKEDETKKLASLGGRVAGMELSKDGKFLAVLANGTLRTIVVGDGKAKSVRVQAKMALDAAAERQYLFDHAWNQANDWFYRGADKHGRNWEAIYAAYKPKVAAIAHNRDMAELLSEVLGELNASHTGGRYRPNGSENGRDRSISLGAIFNWHDTSNGLTIDHLFGEGPLARSNAGVVVGDRLTAVDGTPINNNSNFFALTNNKAGERMRLTLSRADGENYDVVIKPVNLGEENGWRYERWVESRQAEVERLSGGRLGYVHLPFMADSVFRRTYRDVFGRYFAADGLVVDSRWNRGGDLMEDLIRLLTSGDFEYTRNAPYGTPVQGEPLTRWTKPTIVLMNEANYSDGHCFPTAYKNVNGGLLVGTAVTGTCSYVWWERSITGDIIFGVPTLGIFDPEGDWLELKDTQPDIEVYNSPEDRAAGRDPQLETAVEALLRSLDEESR